MAVSEPKRQLVIVGGAEDKEGVQMGPVMGYLPGIVIDQHFSQRGRLGRLISALAQQPAVLGFGIDENTAIVVTDNQLEVIGEGSVTVVDESVDESEVIHSNIDEILKDEPLAMCGARLHILPHGYKFDLKTRKPILENQALEVIPFHPYRDTSKST